MRRGNLSSGGGDEVDSGRMFTIGITFLSPSGTCFFGSYLCPGHSPLCFLSLKPSSIEEPPLGRRDGRRKG